jgi:CDP-2,3-bis-(O-geranylgeranyl)-sn-glycerol synthase
MTAARLLALLSLMAPAYAANMAPPFLRFWRGWNPPLHRRALGAHKTVLGTAAGMAAAMAAAWLLSLSGAPRLLDAATPWWLHGLLCGSGALGGDAIKSLWKRRRGIAPGGRWVPFDQLDFQIGSLLLIGPRASLGPADVATLLALGFLGDLAVNWIAFRIGVKETAW